METSIVVSEIALESDIAPIDILDETLRKKRSVLFDDLCIFIRRTCHNSGLSYVSIG